MNTIQAVVISCFMLLYTSYCVAEQVSTSNSSGNQGQDASHSIEQDIQDLDLKGKAVGEAGKRLIHRGKSAVDKIHKALLDSKTTAQQKATLILVLGVIADERSIGPIINAAASSVNDVLLNVNAINALGRYEQNEPIVQYINLILEDGHRDPKLLYYALEYYSKKPHKDVLSWAHKYCLPEFNENIRTMALYNGALFSDSKIKPKIIDALKTKKKTSNEVFLLVGLANLTSPEEFDSTVREIILDKGNINTAKLHYFLNKGDDIERRTAAVDLIGKHNKYFIRDAINYLITANDADALASFWLRKDAAVLSVLDAAGLTINVTERGAFFDKKQVQSDYLYVDRDLSYEEFIRAVFMTLKDNDIEKFKSDVLMNNDEMAQYMYLVYPVNKIASGEIDKIKKLHKSIEQQIIGSWTTVRDEGMASGIDWTSARLVATNYKQSGYNGDLSMMVGCRGHYGLITFGENIKPTVTNVKLRLSNPMRWNTNKMDSSKLLYWAGLAEHNSDSIAAKELTILSKMTKTHKIPALQMLSSYNDPVAQYQLYSQLNISSKQSEKNEAIQWLSRSAVNNHPRSQYELSEYYLNKYYEKHAIDSSGTNIDLLESKKNLELAAGQNYVLALMKLSQNHSNGHGGYSIDYDNAIKYCKRLLELDIDKMSDIERYYYQTTDIKTIIEELRNTKKGLDSGDPDTLTRLSIQQLEYGSPKRKNSAFQMLESAALQGDAEAQYQLGKVYANGDSVIDKNADKAVEWWEKASNQKHIHAMEDLAYGYMDGKYTISINLDKAVNLTEQLFKYYATIPNDPGSSESVRTWRVNMCNVLNDIKRTRGDNYVITKEKNRHCMRV